MNDLTWTVERLVDISRCIVGKRAKVSFREVGPVIISSVFGRLIRRTIPRISCIDSSRYDFIRSCPRCQMQCKTLIKNWKLALNSQRNGREFHTIDRIDIHRFIGVVSDRFVFIRAGFRPHSSHGQCTNTVIGEIINRAN